MVFKISLEFVEIVEINLKFRIELRTVWPLRHHPFPVQLSALWEMENESKCEGGDAFQAAKMNFQWILLIAFT